MPNTKGTPVTRTKCKTINDSDEELKKKTDLPRRVLSQSSIGESRTSVPFQFFQEGESPLLYCRWSAFRGGNPHAVIYKN